MCDYSLQSVKSRPASVGDKLTTWNFGTGTRGFSAPAVDGCAIAVCLLPGTELAFDTPIKAVLGYKMIDEFNTAIFRQVNKDNPYQHHDALELPDGTLVMLTFMVEGQTATVLQLPATPRNDAEREEQKRVEFAG